MLAKNLKILLSTKDMNLSDLAEKLDLPRSSINRIVTGETLSPKKSTLLALATYFGITINQLIGNEEINWNLIISSSNPSLITIPILSWEQAIHIPNPSNISENKNQQKIKVDIDVSDKAFGLIMEENLENFFKGSVIIIDPNIPAEHRDYVIVHKIGTKKSSLKQLLIDDEIKYIKSLNESQQVTTLSKDYSLIGTIVQSRMDYKQPT